MDSPVRRRGHSSASARRPLRRRPKQLDGPPSLFEPSSGGGMVLVGSRPRERGRAPVPPGRAGGSGVGFTAEAAVLTDSDVADGRDGFVPDPETLRRARRIAARLAVPRPRHDASARRGGGDLASVRFRGGSDEIDLDRTVEALAASPVPSVDDIVVRERVRARRRVVLLVDVSGSMRGERIRTAAATVGALAAELDRDDLAVVAFWSDAAVLSRLGRPVAASTLLDAMLRIRPRGLTNVAFPLEVAGRELAGARAPARDSRVLLLSDCVHNAGPDPRIAAARLPRLDVLFDTSGESDAELARDLAAAGRGRLRRIAGYTDVAPALGAIFEAGYR